MKTLIVSLFLLGYCGSLTATDDFPPPFTAEYTLYAEDFPIGKGTRRLSHLNDTFIFESSSHTTGITALFRSDRIMERTVFTLTKGKVRPLEYTYRHTGTKKQKHIEIKFDWQHKIATYKSRKESKTIPLEEGVLDKLLYQVVLMRDLKQGKRKLKYTVISKGKIKDYTPTFLRREWIEIGLGRVETFKYERALKNRQTTLWCAPDLHYLPVRINHIERGSSLSTVLQSVQGLKQ